MDRKVAEKKLVSNIETPIWLEDCQWDYSAKTTRQDVTETKCTKDFISKLHLQIKEPFAKEPQLEGKIMVVKPFLQSLGISDQNQGSK